MRVRLLLPILALLAAACATQRPPGGGPPDTEAPFIEAVEPEHNATRVESGAVRLKFNEHVDRQSFLEALHVSPLLDAPPEVSWSGRTVTVELPAPLREDQTYVLTVGTSVKDQRAGNRMTSPLTLAFSTGDSIDRGALRGRVYDAQPGTVSVLAYRLTDERADTLDVRRTRPDYAVQTAADGTFLFTNLAAGGYRVIAVRDNNRNFQYDAEIDEVGVPPGDVIAEDSVSRDVLRFVLHREDTTAPVIQSIVMESARMLVVKYSETVLPWPAPPGALTVRDSATGDSAVLLCATDAPGSRFALRCWFSAPIPAGVGILRAEGLADSSGNALRLPADGFTFRADPAPDTSRPELTTIIPRKDESDVPPDSAFTLVFDRPVTAGTASLRDTTDRVYPTVPTAEAPNLWRLTHAPLPQATAFTLCIDGGTWRDDAGARTVFDSTRCVRFRTASESAGGTVSGTVADEDSASTAPRLVVLRDIAGKRAPRRTVADARGAFRFSDVRPGVYHLDAIADRDSSGTPGHGRVYPFTPPERTLMGVDSVRVRARWETGGLRLRIPR